MEPTERQMISRAAWLYYVGGLNQEETAARLGTTRARVNRMLGQAREDGIVSITIDTRETGMLEIEEALRLEFGLDRVISTPELHLGTMPDLPASLGEFPRRATGSIAARLLREDLASRPDAVIGTGWGRSLDQITRHLAGVSAASARFVSLMGSLTANSAFNPFEVVQALARRTGGQGFFLPVPFIADSPEHRDILLSQRTVAHVLDMARNADLTLISVGELTENSLLRQSDMITASEVEELFEAGAVGDTNGIFFDANGLPVDHVLNRRTIAIGFDDLARSQTVLLSAGVEKASATSALLRSGIIDSLVIDGDTARRIYESI